jgi:hypothetical protein
MNSEVGLKTGAMTVPNINPEVAPKSRHKIINLS